MRQARRRRNRVIFPHKPTKQAASANSPMTSRSRLRMDDDRDNAYDGMEINANLLTGQITPLAGHASVPSLFTEEPLIRDSLITKTSTAQDEVAQICVPLLAGAIPGKTEFDFSPAGVPRLEREQHVEFLKKNLQHAKYIPYDPARPWVIYWCLTALSLLGQDVSPWRERVVETLRAAQNRGGGFGGGHGQFSHAAPSYAAICSLAIVGGTEAYELIDRRALWKWLGQLKQGDGGYRMCIGGEEDVRGAYCALSIISLLEIPLDLPPDSPAREAGLATFLDGLPEYLSRCQTYEGGISGSPQTEAHGAYAYCVLASLCMLGPPEVVLPKYLDLPALISWLSSRQYAPEGGLSGRTNKLVDGCYSHWVGGCWPLIDAAVELDLPTPRSENEEPTALYHREGLIRYVMSCCQDELGGMRDKPTANADGYHSCYVLAGLSSTQYRNRFIRNAPANANNGLTSPFAWTSVSRDRQMEGNNSADSLYDVEDTLDAIHPLFTIPWKAVEDTHSYFGSKSSF